MMTMADFKECLIYLVIGVWAMFGLYGFLVAIDLDGSRARLKEYDSLAHECDPFGSHPEGVVKIRKALGNKQ
jgi:hypothetical protein